MWLLELVGKLGSGFGTELGWFNMALLLTVGFFTRREFGRQKAKWDDIPDAEFRRQHQLLWESFAKRALERSGRKSLPGDKELLSQYVLEHLGKKE